MREYPQFHFNDSGGNWSTTIQRSLQAPTREPGWLICLHAPPPSPPSSEPSTSANDAVAEAQQALAEAQATLADRQASVRRRDAEGKPTVSFALLSPVGQTDAKGGGAVFDRRAKLAALHKPLASTASMMSLSDPDMS